MKLRISLEGEKYDVDVEVLPETAAEGADVDHEAELDAALPRPPHPEDTRPVDKICRSPIAGLVVAVMANVNQEVRMGDPLLVIEAMKMQTTIGAPVDGVVEGVHVAPGELVKSRQQLCTLR